MTQLPAGAQDWLTKLAHGVARKTRERRERLGQDVNAPIVCASGISPSGPIHLGNLREVMTTHLVAEELRRMDVAVDHIHSWDDFDRLRKVPAGVPERFHALIGKPIGEIPDPFGDTATDAADSYAGHFIRQFETAVAQIGVRPRYVRQSRMYRSGVYNAGIRAALDQRGVIFEALDRHRTPCEGDPPVLARKAAYYPFQVYCRACGYDLTRVSAWQDPFIDYTCKTCGPDRFNLDEEVAGKLVWKADWPMRWAYEGVDFEPGGEDHSTPGGSFTVGREIVKRVYDKTAPEYAGYGFVGMSGRTKISSSEGSNATPEFALRFIEPALLRWLYVRKTVSSKFTIEFGRDIWRAYDEWDAFARHKGSPKATPLDRLIFDRCSQTSSEVLAQPAHRAPFRLLSAAADTTNGNVDQIVRIVNQHQEGGDPLTADALEPRLGCAVGWATTCLPDDERLQLRAVFSSETHAALAEEERACVALLVERMGDDWSLPGLTRLIYGVPKLRAGLTLDALPSEALKLAQRAFFVAIYRLLIDADTGPRLPTLFLSIGEAHARALLGG